MATKVYMEALSPTMEEGRLVTWHKAEGDAVRSGDVLAEVETDKAIMELVARGDGVLRKRLIAEGATAPVGQLVGVIATPDENIDALVGGAPAGVPPARSAEPAVQEATAGTPRRSEAAAVAERRAGGVGPIPHTPSQSQGEASTPPQEQVPAIDRRAAAERPALASAQPAANAGQTAGELTGTPGAGGNGGRVRSSPLARRLASERGVDLRAIAGTGPNGRVIKRDVEAAPPAGRASAAPARAAPTRVIPVEGDFHDVALTQIRKTIAKRLAESIGPIPTFYLTADFDVERIAEMRAAMATQGEEFKVSVNDIVLKTVATALSHHPEVNAHWMGDRVRYFNRVHIGMAVAVEDGLITPVIFDADMKGLRQIADESRALAERARARRLTPSEYTGSTFSVSNLGMFGIEQFTAIINPPEAGILAVGAMEPRPVVVDGSVIVRRRMRVTMSCDHRVVDGATGARFLQTLRRLIENPLLMVF
jgi:pyruvate dehydrogenase E2 component (dihydrolipoamide acetyltransferase)